MLTLRLIIQNQKDVKISFYAPNFALQWMQGSSATLRGKLCGSTAELGRYPAETFRLSCASPSRYGRLSLRITSR